MAAGHAYIKEKFDDESRQVVSIVFVENKCKSILINNLVPLSRHQ